MEQFLLHSSQKEPTLLTPSSQMSPLQNRKNAFLLFLPASLWYFVIIFLETNHSCVILSYSLPTALGMFSEKSFLYMVPISVFASGKPNLRQTLNFISNYWCVKKIIRRELESLVFLQKKSDTFRN